MGRYTKVLAPRYVCAPCRFAGHDCAEPFECGCQTCWTRYDTRVDPLPLRELLEDRIGRWGSLKDCGLRYAERHGVTTGAALRLLARVRDDRPMLVHRADLIATALDAHLLDLYPELVPAPSPEQEALAV